MTEGKEVDVKSWWDDFLMFRRFITPQIMPVIFWIGIGFSVILGIVDIVDGARIPGGTRLIVTGIFTLFFGPVLVRILCELVLTFFRQER